MSSPITSMTPCKPGRKQPSRMAALYRHPAFRAAEWLLVTAAIVLALWVLRGHDPERNPFVLCYTRRIFGIYCPGCGMTRALHQLLNGHLLASLRYNALLLPVMGVFAWGYVYYFGKRLGLICASWYPRVPTWLLATLGAVALCYVVFRNLPVGAWLAP